MDLSSRRLNGWTCVLVLAVWFLAGTRGTLGALQG